MYMYASVYTYNLRLGRTSRSRRTICIQTIWEHSWSNIIKKFSIALSSLTRLHSQDLFLYFLRIFEKTGKSHPRGLNHHPSRMAPTFPPIPRESHSHGNFIQMQYLVSGQIVVEYMVGDIPAKVQRLCHTTNVCTYVNFKFDFFEIDHRINILLSKSLLIVQMCKK